MLLLYKYKKLNKKGRLVGYTKNVYKVDINDGEPVKVGGLSEIGRRLYSFPEGIDAGRVITDKNILTLSKGLEIESEHFTIYPLI